MGPALDRKYMLLVGSQAFDASSSALVASGASESLLLQLCHGNFNLAQRFEAWINTTGTAIDFILRPLVGTALDTCGRRWALLAGQLVPSFMRVLVWRFPSLQVYTSLRLGMRTLATVQQPALAATYADLLGGRASANYTGAMQRNQAALACGYMLGLVVATRLRLPRTNFGAAALCNFVAAMLVFCIGETLHRERRSSLKLRHPFSWVSFFRRTPRLRRLAAALMLGHAASHNPTERFVVFHRFGLTPQERSRMSAIETLLRLPFQLMVVGQTMLEKLGNELAARWSDRLAALEKVNYAIASHPSFLYLNSGLQVLQPGQLALQREVALEAADSVGHGELEAAMDSLALPVMLLAPPLYAELYAWQPRAPMLLVAFLHLLRSEVVLPWVAQAPASGSKVQTHSEVKNP